MYICLRREPQLRFKEFNDKWEEKKLGDIVSSSSSNLSINTLEDNSGDYPLYGATGFIKNVDFYQKKEKYISIVKDGAGVGRTILCPPFSSILGTLQYLNIKNNNNIDFIYFFLKKLNFNKYIVGSTIPHIYFKDYSKEKLNIPSLGEQEKIANFLCLVDKKIELLEKTLKLLKTYKKGIMQQIFNQKLRFKNENGAGYPEWGEKKLRDIVSSSSSNLSINTLEDNSGDYPLYGATGFIKNVDFYQKKEKYISIVKDGAGVGRTILCPPFSSILGTLQYLNIKNNNNIDFIYFFLKKLNFNKYIVGSTIPHIYFKDYSKEKLNTPSLEEQEKIANFLSKIDEKIEKTAKVLEENKEFKKGLLQKILY
ncbi:restriction endonuclease subunit S [Methanobrevibacter sp. DSM 116169]|uniref:restriction endonuclease subunit S n=1 Tax=Methanobrevibacter sp. DSM 116169 TaxID=3242727 RepID=UPI0038FCDD3F